MAFLGIPLLVDGGEAAASMIGRDVFKDGAKKAGEHGAEKLGKKEAEKAASDSITTGDTSTESPSRLSKFHEEFEDDAADGMDSHDGSSPADYDTSAGKSLWQRVKAHIPGMNGDPNGADGISDSPSVYERLSNYLRGGGNSGNPNSKKYDSDEPQTPSYGLSQEDYEESLPSYDDIMTGRADNFYSSGAGPHNMVGRGENDGMDMAGNPTGEYMPHMGDMGAYSNMGGGMPGGIHERSDGMPEVNDDGVSMMDPDDMPDLDSLSDVSDLSDVGNLSELDDDSTAINGGSGIKSKLEHGAEDAAVVAGGAALAGGAADALSGAGGLSGGILGSIKNAVTGGAGGLTSSVAGAADGSGGGMLSKLSSLVSGDGSSGILGAIGNFVKALGIG